MGIGDVPRDIAVVAAMRLIWILIAFGIAWGSVGVWLAIQGLPGFSMSSKWTVATG